MKKRTKSLSLVLMGSLTVGLGGCASDDVAEEFKAYGTVDECVKEQIFTAQECRDMAVAAVAQNPKFADKAECEREFGEGNCQTYEQKDQTAQSGGSSWMPLIAGYMMGRYLGGGGFMQGAQPLYNQPGAGDKASPAGAGRTSGGFSRSYRTLGGGNVQADAGGKIAAPSDAVRKGFTRSAKPYAPRSGVGTRGGFSGSKNFGSSGS